MIHRGQIQIGGRNGGFAARPVPAGAWLAARP